MKNVLIPTLALGCLAAQPLLAQRADPANSLARARAYFDAADANKDGKLDFDELAKQRLPIKKSEFDAMDVDKSASWSRDEFLVYYRRLLLANRQRPSAELESEVTRVEASRKAKEAETKRTVAPAATGAAANANDLDSKLQTALDELEKKAALRQATRADFDHVRDAWTARAQAAGAQDPAAAGDLKARFEAAMSALETQAKQGNYSREEYNALREQYIARGRNAASQTTAPPVADPDARLQQALDDLARKADARQATREDFTRVRDEWTARAKAASVGADPAVAAQDAALAQKFQAAMDELEKDALAGNWSREKFDAVRQSYVHRARAASGAAAPAPVAAAAAATSGDAASVQKRFDDALDTLETRALARGATREDYQRVKDLLVEHARHSVNAAEGAAPAAADDPRVTALASKLGAAIDQLEEQARAGKITRADFENLRQMLVHRARAAAGTPENTMPNNPVQGAVPTGPGSRAQPKPAEGATPATKGPAEGRRAEKENPTPPAPAPAPAPAPSDKPADKPKPDDGSGGRDKPQPHRG